MCRRILLTLWTAASAAGAFWLLRFAPLPAARSRCIFFAALTVSVLFAALLALPEKGGTRFFSMLRSVLPAAALQGGGALLLMVCGGYQLYLLYPALRSGEALAAAALVLAGLGLLGGMWACTGNEPEIGTFLLLPLAASMIQLTVAYIRSSADPALSHYDIHILFLGAVVISMALLTDFVFARGKRRLTIVLLSLTVSLAGAAAAMAEELAVLGGIVAVALAALGFLLSLLFGFSRRTRYELVEDPFSTGRVRTRSETPGDSAPVSAVEPSPLPADTAEPSLPAENPAPEEEFDLSRVDRLLLELSLDIDMDE